MIAIILGVQVFLLMIAIYLTFDSSSETTKVIRNRIEYYRRFNMPHRLTVTKVQNRISIWKAIIFMCYSIFNSLLLIYWTIYYLISAIMFVISFCKFSYKTISLIVLCGIFIYPYFTWILRTLCKLSGWIVACIIC